MKTKSHCDMSLQGKSLPVHWQLFQLAFWWREEIAIFHRSSLVLINHFQVLASSRNNISQSFEIITTVSQQSSLCLLLFSNYLHYLDDIIFHVQAVRPLLCSWFIVFQSLCLLKVVNRVMFNKPKRNTQRQTAQIFISKEKDFCFWLNEHFISSIHFFEGAWRKSCSSGISEDFDEGKKRRLWISEWNYSALFDDSREEFVFLSVIFFWEKKFWN